MSSVPAHAAPEPLAAFTRDWPLRTHTDANGARWHYRDNQRGEPPLVLLPGALGNGDVAWKVAQGLDDLARVLTVHYPSGLAPDALAEGLQSLLTQLELAPAAVWGSSYGAWWAQAHAARYPASVRTLWLGNTFVDGSDVDTSPLFAPDWLLATSAEGVVARWHEVTVAKPDSELKRLQLHMLHHGLTAEDFRARLLRVAHAPALPPAVPSGGVTLCDCDDDAIITPAVRERVRQRYPGAHRVALPTGGHYPHVLQAEALLPHLRRWFLSDPL